MCQTRLPRILKSMYPYCNHVNGGSRQSGCCMRSSANHCGKAKLWLFRSDDHCSSYFSPSSTPHHSFPESNVIPFQSSFPTPSLLLHYLWILCEASIAPGGSASLSLTICVLFAGKISSLHGVVPTILPSDHPLCLLRHLSLLDLGASIEACHPASFLEKSSISGSAISGRITLDTFRQILAVCSLDKQQPLELC